MSDYVQDLHMHKRIYLSQASNRFLQLVVSNLVQDVTLVGEEMGIAK